MTTALVEKIRSFVVGAPLELASRVCACLELVDRWDAFRSQVDLLVFDPDLKRQIGEIILASKILDISPKALALSVNAAISVESYRRISPTLELIWSGPQRTPYTLRRTDEALLQLIDEAHESLTLISYALYKIDRLTRALHAAITRGVSVRMFIEATEQKAPDLSSLYGIDLAAAIEFFTWTPSKRLAASNGHIGILHAKGAIADGRDLLISSANLTDFALSLNIEMGVLIRDGELPRRVDQLFGEYIAAGLFQRYHVHN